MSPILTKIISADMPNSLEKAINTFTKQLADNNHQVSQPLANKFASLQNFIIRFIVLELLAATCPDKVMQPKFEYLCTRYFDRLTH